MKRLIRNILLNFDHFLIVEKKYILSIYISIIVAFFVAVLGYTKGYYKQENIIVSQKNIIDSTGIVKDSLVRQLDDYAIDIDAYNKLVDDKDYIRYIAFKYSDITIPKSVPKEDLKLINRMCEKYEVPQEYIWRLINKESRYNPTAKSHKGASGYMQIMPGTYSGLKSRYEKNEQSLTKYTQSHQNIILGIYYLHILYKTYNDWTLVFAAYNAGPGKVQEAGNRVPNINETKNYVKYIKK